MLEEIARHDADVICLQVWFALELMSIIGTFEAEIQNSILVPYWLFSILFSGSRSFSIR